MGRLKSIAVCVGLILAGIAGGFLLAAQGRAGAAPQAAPHPPAAHAQSLWYMRRSVTRGLFLCEAELDGCARSRQKKRERSGATGLRCRS